MIVTRPSYSVHVVPERARAVLRDAAGQVWSVLSLVASADRTDARDETLPGISATLEEDGDVTRIVVHQPSAAWAGKTVTLACHPDRLSLCLSVEGGGWLTDVSLLGGRAVLPNGAAGMFRSSQPFRTVFVPTPTEPIAVARPVTASAVLSAVGDTSAGRLHGVFSPPPLCLAFGRTAPAHPLEAPEGDWLAAWLEAGVDAMTFTRLVYAPLDGGFRIRLDYEAHTLVDGAWTSPALVLKPTGSAWAALAEYADAVTPERGRWPVATPSWWSEPIFCGWGAQCAEAVRQLRDSSPADAWTDPWTLAEAAVERAAGLATRDNYDAWLARLAAHGVHPGTVVLDDKWQAGYGDAHPDPVKWPDLKGWIARQHATGRRVVLWFKAWDPEGLPLEECITDGRGNAVAADPGSPAYQIRLRRLVAGLLAPDGLDADGFKVDFTQRLPSGASLRGCGPWGIAGLHRLLQGLYEAAKEAKSDALVITHTVHPAFADVTDMIRLNDVLRYDTAAASVPVEGQLRFRQQVARAVLPGKLVDTDQWPMPSRAEWRAYVEAQWRLGVPALYYVDSIDKSGEELTSADLERVAATWRAYAARER